MAKTTMTLSIYAGEPRTHIWCDGCLTSAGWEVDVLTMNESGVTRLTTISRCSRCSTS